MPAKSPSKPPRPGLNGLIMVAEEDIYIYISRAGRVLYRLEVPSFQGQHFRYEDDHAAARFHYGDDHAAALLAVAVENIETVSKPGLPKAGWIL